MCGVCGVVGSGSVAAKTAIVAGLNDRQQHRGPDGAGLWSCDGATLGQTRLAIVDLTEGGRQPFVAADGSVCIVFNGEIYNHEELRRTYRLATRDACDGAILPELWQRLGPAMFGTLRGMFAIAVYDLRAQSITLARDPFGIKPLYWTRMTGGGLAFSSEARSLLPLLSRPTLSRSALRSYLMFGAVGRDESPFTEIESVAANSWVQWDRDLVRRDGAVRTALLSDLAATSLPQLRAEFLRSVSLHLLSDVPMALLLSSGLDSSALAWACAELGTSLACVTVDMGVGVSEQTGARQVANRFGHSHEIVSAAPDEHTVDSYFSAMQRPSVDGLNVFLVSRAVASLGLKAALTGLGGDEVLGGYRTFGLLRYLPLLRAGDALSATRLLGRMCQRRNAKLAALLDPAGPRDAEGLGRLFRRVLLDDQIRSLAPWAAPAQVAALATGDRSARRLSLTELSGYLGGTLLPDADAYSMAWSVELRVPFIDADFVPVALGVDAKRGVGKRAFAETLGDRHLATIARQPKHGFNLPMDSWMRTGPLAAAVRAAQAPDAPVRQVLRPAAADEIMTAWRDGRLTWSRAWSIVVLDSWLRSLSATGSIEVPVLQDDSDNNPAESVPA